MKKHIYIGLFMFLGFLVQQFVHASLSLKFFSRYLEGPNNKPPRDR